MGRKGTGKPLRTCRLKIASASRVCQRFLLMFKDILHSSGLCNPLSFSSLVVSMQALILAGGKGTRLRPLTVYTPKPIVPVVNRPFLLYQIDVLKKAGITDIALSLSYQPDKIQQILGDGSDFDVSLTYITEPSPMGTGGAYKFAEDALRETTVVFNGDILTTVDLTKILELHQAKGARGDHYARACGRPFAVWAG